MKKILVPTDFSEQADHALEAAAKIAEKSKAKIVLLHIVEGATTRNSTFSVIGEMSFNSPEEQFFTLKMIEKARGEIDARVNDPQYENVEIHYEIQVGNPYHGIKNIISEHDVDLVVMGTAGADSFEEYLVGSTTEKVVRFAKSPVLTIHKKPSTFDYKNIVLATGLKEEELEFIEVLSVIQKLYNSKVHIVRINTPNNFEKDRDSLESLKEFAKRSKLENYTLNVFNDITEEEGIIYFSEHIKADMIAMATHGRTGFAHLLSGSIAEDVVSHANRPVLTHVIGK